MWRGQPAVTQSATFNSYGRVSWAVLAQATRDAAIAWADYDGFHVGAVPATAPPYTHLWAWTDTWMLRARLDGDQAIVATLHLNDSALSGITPCEPASTVTVTRHLSYTWPSGEQRVGPLAAEVADQPVELYQIAGTHPVTFVRLTPSEAGRQ